MKRDTHTEFSLILIFELTSIVISNLQQFTVKAKSKNREGSEQERGNKFRKGIVRARRVDRDRVLLHLNDGGALTH